MERLTQWFGFGNCRKAGIAPHLEGEYTAEQVIDILADKLARYEDTGMTPKLIRAAQETLLCFDNIGIKRGNEIVDAEEQGRLVVLPCKVGDEVWGIRSYRGVKHPQRGRVNDMFFTKDMRLMIVVKHICYGTWGKNVFPTLEAAEAALATDKMSGTKEARYDDRLNT